MATPTLIKNNENEDTLVNMNLVTNVLRTYSEGDCLDETDNRYNIHFCYSELSDSEEPYITWEFKTKESRDETFNSIDLLFQAIAL